MTKQVQLIAATPEILKFLSTDHTAERFKFSIVCELLRGRLQTMEVQFYEGNREAYSSDDWQDFVTGAEFLNGLGVSQFATATLSEVQTYINSL